MADMTEDSFALLCDAVDVTTEELHAAAIALLDAQVLSAHRAFDAIAEGSHRPPKKPRKRRRTPRQMGYTAT